MKHRVFIALGSNLGERQKNLEQAVNLLASLDDITIKALSSILETSPVDYTAQPDFLNQMIIVETNLSPEELLKKLKEIEVKLGRKKSFAKGPRLIDLDIILYDDLIYSTQRLTIPHKERFKRFFILKHLVELDKNLRDPVTREKYDDVYQSL